MHFLYPFTFVSRYSLHPIYRPSGQFLLIILLETAMVTMVGLMVSAVAPNIEAANAMGIPLVIVSLVFGGFYINLETLPPVAEWMPYLSVIRWPFEALAINEFTGEVRPSRAGADPGSGARTGDDRA